MLGRGRKYQRTYQSTTFTTDNIRDDFVRRVRVGRNSHKRLNKELGIGIKHKVLPSILVEDNIFDLSDVKHLPGLALIRRAVPPTALAFAANFVCKVEAFYVRWQEIQQVVSQGFDDGVTRGL